MPGVRILTGLRFPDIKYLTWSELRWETQILSHGRARRAGAFVFKGLYYNQVCDLLVSWPTAAGLPGTSLSAVSAIPTQTLRLNHGTDIYTVSKNAGAPTRQNNPTLTRLLENKKRETTSRIVFEFNRRSHNIKFFHITKSQIVMRNSIIIIHKYVF